MENVLYRDHIPSIVNFCIKSCLCLDKGSKYTGNKLVEIKVLLSVRIFREELLSQCKQLCKSIGIKNIEDNYNDWFRLCVVLTEYRDRKLTFEESLLNSFITRDYDLGEVVIRNRASLCISDTLLVNCVDTVNEKWAVDTFRLFFILDLYKQLERYGMDVRMIMTNLVARVQKLCTPDCLEYLLSLEYVREKLSR